MPCPDCGSNGAPKRDPGLIIDNRNALGPLPGLHALFIGVSDYAFLTHPDDEPPGDGMAALQKLRSPALSAFRLKETVLAMEKAGQLLKPVKTVRLLTAPMFEEKQTEPRLETEGGDWPWFATIRTAIRQWRTDMANGGPEDQGILHFSGHGTRTIGNDVILLAADFDPAGEVMLENAFGFQNIYDAMAPNARHPDVARTQFYLIDACRNSQDALQQIEDPQPSRILDVRPPLRDDRKAPVAYATRNGGTAAAIAGEPTEFTTGLIWALEHGSVEKRTLSGRAKPGWVICYDSMKQCLNATRPDLAPRLEFTGLGAEAPLCVRADPPMVDVRLSFAPATAEQSIHSAALLEGNTKTPTAATRLADGSCWQGRVASGIYNLQVKPANGEFPEFMSELENINLGKVMPWAITLGGV